MKAKKIKKYEDLWIKIRDLTRSISKNSDNYDEEYRKIKFDSDDNLPLNKVIKNPIMTIVARVIFHKINKYYPSFYR